MNNYIKIGVLSIIFICLDLGWIILNKNIYLDMVANIQKEKFQITNIIYYIITYIVMLLGLFIICITFVETQIQKYNNVDKYLVAFLAGGFYGIIVNSIYNFTSLSVYNNYSLFTSIIDICWAFIFYGTMSVLYVKL